MSGRRILVVDDEPRMRRVLEIMLRKMGHEVASAADGHEALQRIQGGPVDLVISDLRMPGMGGIELLNALRTQGNNLPVIVITAHGTIQSAVEAMKLGACEYMLRPFDMPVLQGTIDRILAARDMARQNDFLRHEIEREWGGFVGEGVAMKAIYEQIRLVAPNKTTVLITGETGTGKELVARAIHRASPRAEELFVPINCAAIPDEMLESELFGYEKGAFTGAHKDRVGKFELAHGGTLFLDELPEMPIGLQAKLLRVLQESVIERLGSNRPVPIDIRLIAATNRDPQVAIAENRLREDLYYRVNVFSITLPPLRDRPEDIPGLVHRFLVEFGRSESAGLGISDEAMARLKSYSWPGNVRELKNVVERAVVLAAGQVLDVGHFPLAEVPGRETGTPAPAAACKQLNSALEGLEEKLIREALGEAQGNKARAARQLGISERSLWYKVKKYGLD